MLSTDDSQTYLFLTSYIMSISLSLSDVSICDSNNSIMLLVFSVFLLLSTCNVVCFKLVLYCDNERNLLENDTLLKLFSLS